MSKVYVTQYSNRRNFSDAEKYGEVVEVCRTEIYADMEAYEYPVSLIDASMKKFNLKNDYLLLSGDPAIIAMCVARLIMLQPIMEVSPVGHFKALKFDKLEKMYYQINVPI